MPHGSCWASNGPGVGSHVGCICRLLVSGSGQSTGLSKSGGSKQYVRKFRFAVLAFSLIQEVSCGHR